MFPVTFPADFDPFTATDEQVAELVRQLWGPAKQKQEAEDKAYGEWLDREEAGLLPVEQ